MDGQHAIIMCDQGWSISSIDHSATGKRPLWSMFWKMAKSWEETRSLALADSKGERRYDAATPQVEATNWIWSIFLYSGHTYNSLIAYKWCMVYFPVCERKNVTINKVFCCVCVFALLLLEIPNPNSFSETSCPNDIFDSKPLPT